MTLAERFLLPLVPKPNFEMQIISKKCVECIEHESDRNCEYDCMIMRLRPTVELAIIRFLIHAVDNWRVDRLFKHCQPPGRAVETLTARNLQMTFNSPSQ